MSKFFTVQRLTALALLTAVCYIGRIAFQFIPNVQPVTAILLLITLLMGTWDGIIVASGSMVISNMLLGMGPWTLYQILTYAMIMAVTGGLRKFYVGLETDAVKRRVIFALYAGFTGLLYGFLISFFSANLFGITNFWVYYLQGLSFDVLHAIGNVGFFLVLEPTLGPLIQKRMHG